MVAQLEYEKNEHVKASIITLLVAGLVMVLLFIITFVTPNPPFPAGDEGMEGSSNEIELGFGMSDVGGGNVISEHLEEATNQPEQQEATPPPQPTPEANDAPPITNDAYETAINEPKKEKPDKKKEKPVVVKQPPKEKVPEPSELDKISSVFAKKSKSNSNSSNTSQDNGKWGPDDEGGMQGRPNGTPGETGTGLGDGGPGKGGIGNGFELGGMKGRYFVHKPEHIKDATDEGIVVVEITVAPDGTVKSAEVIPRGTNTTNRDLYNKARAAARSAKISPDPEGQTKKGTIKFVFELH